MVGLHPVEGLGGGRPWVLGDAGGEGGLPPEMVADLNLFALNEKEILDSVPQEPGAWLLARSTPSWLWRRDWRGPPSRARLHQTLRSRCGPCHGSWQARVHSGASMPCWPVAHPVWKYPHSEGQEGTPLNAAAASSGEQRCWGWWSSPQLGGGGRRRAPSNRRTSKSRSRDQRERDWEYDPRTAFDEPGGSASSDPRVMRNVYAQKQDDGKIAFRVEGSSGSDMDIAQSLSTNDWARLAKGETRNFARRALRTSSRLFRSKYGRWPTELELKAFAVYRTLLTVGFLYGAGAETLIFVTSTSKAPKLFVSRQLWIPRKARRRCLGIQR